jgi:hypothetical protein
MQDVTQFSLYKFLNQQWSISLKYYNYRENQCEEFVIVTRDEIEGKINLPLN